MESGPRFAVDHEHIVAFAVPHRSGVVDVVVDSNVVSTSFGIENDVVIRVRGVVAVWAKECPFVFVSFFVFWLSEFLVVLGVEVGGVLGECPEFFVIHIEIESFDAVFGRLIEDFNFCGFGKGHWEVTNKGATIFGGAGEEWGAKIVVESPAVAEEISDWALDTGVRVVIPSHADDEVFSVVGVKTVDGYPDVLNDAGTLAVEEGE